MTEEIYIDGKGMDLDAGKTNVQLIFQSPVLMDFQNIVSNRTTQVSLPLTQNNLNAIGYTGTQAVSNYSYIKHSVIYKRDGVQLLKGIATLMGIKANSISFCFTWGNVTALETLFDTNLREIGGANEAYSTYPPTTSKYENNLDYGAGRKGVSVPVADVLTRIEGKCGISGLSGLDTLSSYYKLHLGLMTRNGDAHTKYLQRFRFGTDVVGELKSYGQFRYMLIGPNTSQMRDYHGYYDADSMTIYTNGAKKARIRFNATMKYVYLGQDFPYPDGNPAHFVGLTVLKMNDTTIDASTAGADLVAATEDQQTGSGPYYLRYLLTGSADTYYDVNVEGYSYIALCVLNYDSQYANQPAVFLPATASATDISVEFDPEVGEDVFYNTGLTSYPVYFNLPDMSCGQFIKNLLWMRGEFAYSKDGKALEIISFNQIMANKGIAVDWTDKLKNKPSERTTTLEGTAQRNLFRYGEADYYDNTQYEGVLYTEDETIELVTDYCECDLAVSPSNKVPVWEGNAEDGYTFNGDSLTPFMITRVGLTAKRFNDVQRWENLLTMYYQQYARMIRKPVALKVEVVLSTFDLYKLDMTIPVFLKQTGHYYLIRKLTTKSGGLAEGELIQI